MIFVTVGSQLPFDRLIRGVDDWAGQRGEKAIFAQIGPDAFVPKNFPSVPFMQPEEFNRRMSEASAIVSHAGMGTILTALEIGKPILVMPRTANLRETRNDHQLATAEKFKDKKGFLLALNEEQLFQRLDEIERMEGPDRIETKASQELIEALRQFINAD